jgi:hypothetical protein
MAKHKKLGLSSSACSAKEFKGKDADVLAAASAKLKGSTITFLPISGKMLTSGCR